MIDRNATLRKNAEFGSRKIVRPIILPKIIALFGAGQLGSRHLQALAKIDMPVKIYVIDPSDNALQIAHERYLEIPKNEEILKIEFLSKHSEMDEIHTNIDLCIIATNADVRYQVFQEIISARMVSNIIFEKIVFQSVRDFEKASKLLIEKHISCWVNYPRRLFSIYEELKPLFFKKNERINFSVTGGDWGLACNGIHFIDLLFYLTGDTKYHLDISGLDPCIWPSKRSGFVEVTGTIIGVFSRGSRIKLESIAGSNEPLLIHIDSSYLNIIINEIDGIARIAKEVNCWNEEEIIFKTSRQSELTHIVAMEILRTGNCKLAKFNESFLEHQPFLKAINKHVEAINHCQYSLCPIT